VTVVGGAAKPPTAAERRVLAASDRVRLVDGGSSPGTPAIRGRNLKARACREHGGDSAVIVWIDPGAVLCSALDDVAEACLASGKPAGDPDDDPALLLATPAALAAWSESPGEPALEPLDPALWFPREAHWNTIIDFQPPRFLNTSASGRQHRMFHSGLEHPFACRSHRERVTDSHPLQAYPYVWFLAMLWFGRCADWLLDPFEYLPEESRHLFDDLIHFLPQIAQVLPWTRYRWNALSEAMIRRATDGIPCFLQSSGGMEDLTALVDAHPWIRRYVEVGGYEGGSILRLGLRFLVRDIDFYTVESFMGNADGATEELGRLPSRRRFLEHLARFPGLRVRLVPGDSGRAAALFDDGSLDCVFLDGCHATWAVLRDIDAWLPKLGRPAILAGDDYNWDTVYQAVHTRFAEVNITRCGVIWWVLLA
jgi:Methyltransferase domain